jgi:hypothetical protein
MLLLVAPQQSLKWLYQLVLPIVSSTDESSIAESLLAPPIFSCGRGRLATPFARLGSKRSLALRPSEDDIIFQIWDRKRRGGERPSVRFSCVFAFRLNFSM